ncbi:MAG: hypothetical protein IPH62_19845 [Ignavibacteriae bacterium]|nr:hypothetical protein [Ignavibacteriota bacterium]
MKGKKFLVDQLIFNPMKKCSGESLVRQFYFWKKWLKNEFNYDAKVYWNVDVPGRVLQMPQILKNPEQIYGYKQI